MTSLPILRSVGPVWMVILVAACDPRATRGGITTERPASAAPSDSGANLRAPAPAARPSAAPHVRLVRATEDTDALSLIRTKRLEARSEGRVLVVYIGAAWCDPCKAFKAELESGRLDDRLGAVTLLAFDADGDADRLEAAGYAYRFVPFVALPSADGRAADMQQATGKGGQAWRELLDKLDAWQAARQDTGQR